MTLYLPVVLKINLLPILLLSVLISCNQPAPDQQKDNLNLELIKKINLHSKLSYDLSEEKISGDLNVTDAGGKTKKLKDVISGNTLVLRLAQEHCEECTAMTLSSLLKVTASNKRFAERCLLLISVNENNYIKYMVNRFKIGDIKVYRIEKDVLSYDVEKYANPYLFTINKDLVIHDVHVPVGGMPVFTNSYLDVISGKITK